MRLPSALLRNQLESFICYVLARMACQKLRHSQFIATTRPTRYFAKKELLKTISQERVLNKIIELKNSERRLQYGYIPSTLPQSTEIQYVHFGLDPVIRCEGANDRCWLGTVLTAPDKQRPVFSQQQTQSRDRIFVRT
jgi:hypothetical protein